MLKLLAFLMAFIWCVLRLAIWATWRWFRIRPSLWLCRAQNVAFFLYGLLFISHSFWTQFMRFHFFFFLNPVFIPPFFYVSPGLFVAIGLATTYAYAVTFACVVWKESFSSNPTWGILYAIITAFVLFIVPEAFFALCFWLFL